MQSLESRRIESERIDITGRQEGTLNNAAVALKNLGILSTKAKGYSYKEKKQLVQETRDKLDQLPIYPASSLNVKPNDKENVGLWGGLTRAVLESWKSLRDWDREVTPRFMMGDKAEIIESELARLERQPQKTGKQSKYNEGLQQTLRNAMAFLKGEQRPYQKQVEQLSQDLETVQKETQKIIEAQKDLSLESLHNLALANKDDTASGFREVRGRIEDMRDTNPFVSNQQIEQIKSISEEFEKQQAALERSLGGISVRDFIHDVTFIRSELPSMKEFTEEVKISLQKIRENGESSSPQSEIDELMTKVAWALIDYRLCIKSLDLIYGKEEEIYAAIAGIENEEFRTLHEEAYENYLELRKIEHAYRDLMERKLPLDISIIEENVDGIEANKAQADKSIDSENLAKLSDGKLSELRQEYRYLQSHLKDRQSGWGWSIESTRAKLKTISDSLEGLPIARLNPEMEKSLQALEQRIQSLQESVETNMLLVERTQEARARKIEILLNLKKALLKQRLPRFVERISEVSEKIGSQATNLVSELSEIIAENTFQKEYTKLREAFKFVKEHMQEGIDKEIEIYENLLRNADKEIQKLTGLSQQVLNLPSNV